MFKPKGGDIKRCGAFQKNQLKKQKQNTKRKDGDNKKYKQDEQDIQDVDGVRVVQLLCKLKEKESQNQFRRIVLLGWSG